MKFIDSIKLRWVSWVWNHTPNCAEMSRLSSLRLDRRLPLKVRLKMRLHFVICIWCRRYFNQLEQLHHHSHRMDEYFGAMGHRGLSSEARQRILRNLKEAHG